MENVSHASEVRSRWWTAWLLSGRSALAQRLLVILALIWMLVLLGVPLVQLLVKSFQNADGTYAGFKNFRAYLLSPALSASLAHSFFAGAVAGAVSVVLAFLYAYGLTRTRMWGKSFFKYLAILPLFAPTMTHGIALIYLFGKQGLVTKGLFGTFAGLDIHLYGPVGIILAEIVYVFPSVVLMLTVSLSAADERLYEAATSLGASKTRQLLSVTLPAIKYGLISAFFVAFTLSFTDFGAPKVVGGNYQVLAVQVYNQVVGQQNFPMGATISVILLIPAVVAFTVDQIMQKRQRAVISPGSMPLILRRYKSRDRFFQVYCSVIGGAILVLFATVILASLVKFWPYNLSLTLSNFSFSKAAGYGVRPFLNSILVAAMTALFGTVLIFGSGYVVEKLSQLAAARRLIYFASVASLAVPGTVIGLAYVFFFNRATLKLPFTSASILNPLHFIYGTAIILVLANVVHFYSVPFITATASLKQLDRQYEQVGQSLAVPAWRTFGRVTIPMCAPAILELAMYLFVNAMTTVSAVVFLYSANWKLASVAIVDMDEAGAIASAAAMSVLIVAANLAVRLLYELGTRKLRTRSVRWQIQ